MKFKRGDKVYLDKRGIFGGETRDWTTFDALGCVRLEKNKIYIIIELVHNQVGINGNTILYNENHFVKYEEEI